MEICTDVAKRSWAMLSVLATSSSAQLFFHPIIFFKCVFSIDLFFLIYNQNRNKKFFCQRFTHHLQTRSSSSRVALLTDLFSTPSSVCRCSWVIWDNVLTHVKKKQCYYFLIPEIYTIYCTTDSQGLRKGRTTKNHLLCMRILWCTTFRSTLVFS